MCNAMKNKCIILSMVAIISLLFASKAHGGDLDPHFYNQSCPNAQGIVKSVVRKAIIKELRMGASLLRLHFLDCFVQGCDASLLLDSSGSIISEKESEANKNSARGFEVIDEIKAEIEKECPLTVSCADILAIAARDSTSLLGGPDWEVALGRRDSVDASLSGSNNHLPAPNATFETILSEFTRQGLDLVDLVALSGAHTIGKARCISFQQRLYNQNGDGKPDDSLDHTYRSKLRSECPPYGGDQNLSNLDTITPYGFDKYYYWNLMHYRGVLNSDQVLYTENRTSSKLVWQYASNNDLFVNQFPISMVKMGNILPLTGADGEIRENCRRVNDNELVLLEIPTVIT